MSSSHTGLLGILISLAVERRTAQIIYRKGVTTPKLEPRIIEPYALVQGKQDIMIRAY